MARGAIEVVQAAYEAFGRGDLPGVMEYVADGAEWTFVGARGLPYTGRFQGKEQIARWFASIPQVDEIQKFEPRELLGDGDHVTVLGRERTVAHPGGRAFEAEWVHVFTVRDGRVTRFWGMYDTQASAEARAEGRGAAV